MEQVDLAFDKAVKVFATFFAGRIRISEPPPLSRAALHRYQSEARDPTLWDGLTEFAQCVALVGRKDTRAEVVSRIERARGLFRDSTLYPELWAETACLMEVCLRKWSDATASDQAEQASLVHHVTNRLGDLALTLDSHGLQRTLATAEFDTALQNMGVALDRVSADLPNELEGTLAEVKEAISSPAMFGRCVAGTFLSSAKLEDGWATQAWLRTRVVAEVVSDRLPGWGVVCRAGVRDGDTFRIVADSRQAAPDPSAGLLGADDVHLNQLTAGAALANCVPIENTSPTSQTDAISMDLGEVAYSVVCPVEAGQSGSAEALLYAALYRRVPAQASSTHRPRSQALRLLRCVTLFASESLADRSVGLRHERLRRLCSQPRGMDLLRDELASLVRGASVGDFDRRLAFAVTAASFGDRPHPSHAAAQSILDSWARNTALALPTGTSCFSLDRTASYVAVVPSLPESEWLDWRSSARFANGRTLHQFRMPSGEQAGHGGIWIVAWRYDWLARAREALQDSVEVASTILAQLQMAAREFLKLNRLYSAWAAGDVATAMVLAREIAADPETHCASVFNDLIRFALLLGDRDAAMKASEGLKGTAFWAWDITAHANYMFSLVANGRFEDARSELKCNVCADAVRTCTGDAARAMPALTIARTMASFVGDLKPRAVADHHQALSTAIYELGRGADGTSGLIQLFQRFRTLMMARNSFELARFGEEVERFATDLELQDAQMGRGEGSWRERAALKLVSRVLASSARVASLSQWKSEPVDR